MPAKKDPTKKDDKGRYKSTVELGLQYDKDQYDKIILRVPKGSNQAIKDYVAQKAEADPENLKYNSYNGKTYRPSVNALVRALLEEEMGIDFDELKAASKSDNIDKDES